MTDIIKKCQFIRSEKCIQLEGSVVSSEWNCIPKMNYKYALKRWSVRFGNEKIHELSYSDLFRWT